ncbi:MAG: hypothetical protein KatS3mg081_0972 [Gemmatimonadales bacterium]|nr:hypothetical protein HRbin33_00218 [bacterium HR33]GIW51617.1 MAG: hypothetical protein KatS3mg081_0972 [Gemmatimonadales bacterium]
MNPNRGRSNVRAGLVAAVGFLLLDAVLLVLAGWWSGRAGLVVWGAVFFLGAVGVVVVWRRYLAHLGELEAARRAARKEVDRMRIALKEGQR